MRLVLRLTLALFVIVGVALLYDGAIRVRREIQIYESDNRADRQLVAATLAAALSAALKSEAPEEGERMVAAADAGSCRSVVGSF